MLISVTTSFIPFHPQLTIMHTYLSTDWLEVGGIGFSTMVKVVLTDESEAYLISVTKAGKPEAGAVQT